MNSLTESGVLGWGEQKIYDAVKKANADELTDDITEIVISAVARLTLKSVSIRVKDFFKVFGMRFILFKTKMSYSLTKRRVAKAEATVVKVDSSELKLLRNRVENLKEKYNEVVDKIIFISKRAFKNSAYLDFCRSIIFDAYKEGEFRSSRRFVYSRLRDAALNEQALERVGVAKGGQENAGIIKQTYTLLKGIFVQPAKEDPVAKKEEEGLNDVINRVDGAWELKAMGLGRAFPKLK